MKKQIAVVGDGYWGKSLVRNFDKLGVLKTVCEANSKQHPSFTPLAQGADFTKSYSEVLSDPEIQGVVIATPAVTRFDLAYQARKAGKDVFCEKLLTLRYEEAVRLQQLATEKQRILMVSHILEYHPAILTLRNLLSQGEQGKVRREENILWSFAPHDIAIILRLVGDLPFQVIANGGNYIQPNIADITMTQLSFDNGTSAHIFVSWLNPFKEQKLVVVRSKKIAVFDDVQKSLVLYDQRVDLQAGEPIPIKGEGEQIPFSDAEPFLKVLQAAQHSLITHGQTIGLRLKSPETRATIQKHLTPKGIAIHYPLALHEQACFAPYNLPALNNTEYAA